MNTAFTRIAALLAPCLALALGLAASAQDLNVGIAKFQGGDYSGALRDLVPFAEQGSATAQFSLAVAYLNGDGVAQDPVLAHVRANVAAAPPISPPQPPYSSSG